MKEASSTTTYYPNQAKTKGRNKGNRMKPSRENIKTRNSMCKCKHHEQNYIFRTCPSLKQE